MSKIGLAVIANCFTVIISLFLATLMCAAIGMSIVDANSLGKNLEVLSSKEILGIYASAFGISLLATAPSWILIYLRKPLSALVASAIPLIPGVCVVLFLTYV